MSVRATLRSCLGLLLLLAALPAGADFSVVTRDDEQVDVKVFAPEGEAEGPLFVWLVAEYGHHEGSDDQARGLAAAGSTVWQVDLLESYFLDRSSRNVREMSGEGVRRLAQAAAERGFDQVVFVGTERFGVPILRGLRRWQSDPGQEGVHASAILLYPNLYAGTPVAGRAPELMPVARATNMPVFLFQPAEGANQFRAEEMFAALNAAGGTAYTWVIPGVRDWFHVHTEAPTEREAELQDNLPRALRNAAAMLADAPQPAEAPPLEAEPVAVERRVGLVAIDERPVAPDFTLEATRGGEHRLSDYRGQVVLVNFWATWCPSCVEEIPSMNRLAAGFEDDEFAILSVNFKQPREEVAAFLEQVQVDFPVLLDIDGAVSEQWNVFSFPSSFLIDREGRIRYSVNVGILWDKPKVARVVEALVEAD